MVVVSSELETVKISKSIDETSNALSIILVKLTMNQKSLITQQIECNLHISSFSDRYLTDRYMFEPSHTIHSDQPLHQHPTLLHTWIHFIIDFFPYCLLQLLVVIECCDLHTGQPSNRPFQVRASFFRATCDTPLWLWHQYSYIWVKRKKMLHLVGLSKSIIESIWE